MNVDVTHHAVERYIQHFDPDMTEDEIRTHIKRMFKRGSVVSQKELTEYRKKGRIHLVAALHEDDNGRFNNRTILTVYKGSPKLRHEVS